MFNEQGLHAYTIRTPPFALAFLLIGFGALIVATPALSLPLFINPVSLVGWLLLTTGIIHFAFISSVAATHPIGTAAATLTVLSAGIPVGAGIWLLVASGPTQPIFGFSILLLLLTNGIMDAISSAAFGYSDCSFSTILCWLITLAITPRIAISPSTTVLSMISTLVGLGVVTNGAGRLILAMKLGNGRQRKLTPPQLVLGDPTRCILTRQRTRKMRRPTVTYRIQSTCWRRFSNTLHSYATNRRPSQ